MKQITIICVLLFLLSCGNESLKIVTLNTDLPEVVSYVEAFNKSSDSIKILIETDPNNKIKGDIIIFRGQKDDTTFKARDLSYLFEEKIDKNMFYTDIIRSVIKSDNSCNALPLSFNMTGLIYNKENFSHNNYIDINRIIQGDDLKFSPYWNPEFIFWYYLSNLPNFNIENNYFDKDEFTNSAISINKMLTNREGDWDLEQFNKKYMHLSPERLVDTSIIDYYFFTLSDYLNIDKKYYTNLAFSFLTNNELISIKDEMIYVAVNRESRMSKESDEILTWMFNIENQTDFIKRSYNELELYPLFNGELSTLKPVTTNVITMYYPELNRLIPSTDIITTPISLPPLWNSLKFEVFNPMFNEIKTTPTALWKKKYDEYYLEWDKKHNK